jgi:hypothetical protein
MEAFIREVLKDRPLTGRVPPRRYYQRTYTLRLISQMAEEPTQVATIEDPSRSFAIEHLQGGGFPGVGPGRYCLPRDFKANVAASPRFDRRSMGRSSWFGRQRLACSSYHSLVFNGWVAVRRVGPTMPASGAVQWRGWTRMLLIPMAFVAAAALLIVQAVDALANDDSLSAAPFIVAASIETPVALWFVAGVVVARMERTNRANNPFCRGYWRLTHRMAKRLTRSR